MPAKVARRLHPPEPAVLEVEEFDAHGTSRALFKDRWIEVEHGIPGEQVQALVNGRRRRWAKITSVTRPAPDRVEAPCPHFHEGCGGCQWQMLAYESQRERKRRRAEAAFADHGFEIVVPPPRSSPEPWRYRATAGISLGHAAGFRRRGSQSIVTMRDCPISDPLIGELAATLNQAIGSGAIPNFLGEVAVEARLVERNGGTGLHTCIVPSPGSRHASLEAVLPLALHLTNLDSVVGVMYRHRQQLPELMFGERFGWITITAKLFAVSAATFFQTNLALLPELLSVVLGAAPTNGVETVVDIYGGVGLFGLCLAPGVGRVIEIEVDPVGIEAAHLSCRQQGLHNVDFMTGTAETLLADIEHADIVVVDPPRSGLTPKVVDAICRLRPPVLLYVSCLASSMARDAAIFKSHGYALGRLEAFDFYPQTYHLELFGALMLQ